jgi:hypothetical protein
MPCLPARLTLSYHMLCLAIPAACMHERYLVHRHTYTGLLLQRTCPLIVRLLRALQKAYAKPGHQDPPLFDLRDSTPRPALINNDNNSNGSALHVCTLWLDVAQRDELTA